MIQSAPKLVKRHNIIFYQNSCFKRQQIWMKNFKDERFQQTKAGKCHMRSKFDVSVVIFGRMSFI